MSNANRFIDRNASLRAAGVTNPHTNDNARGCIQPAEVSKPETPPEIRRYRKSFNADAGMKQTHYGTVNDPLPPEAFTYGKPTYKSDHVNEIIAAQKSSGLANYSNELKEQKY